MAIAGIIVGKDAGMVTSVDVQRMRGAVAQSNQALVAEYHTTEAGAVVASPFRTASLCAVDDICVATDCDLLNTRELSEKAGCAPSSTGALIAALYRRSGPDFLRLLCGSFSIAIWDRRARCLLLAIDQTGIKPLVYALSGKQIMFASHSRGIFCTGRIEKQVNPRAIVDYLNFSAVAAPHSAFAGLTKMMPGCYLLWQDGRVESHQYWDLNYTEEANANQAALACETLERMEKAVLRTSAGLSPHETGCFLSGGTDSSSVLGLLARATNAPVNSFSIGFREERFNELHYAHIAARHFSSNHRDRILSPADAYAAIPRITEAYDEPFGNSSVIPTYYCLETAREAGIEVMLAGDGGDELFGGNERYRTNAIFESYKRIPSPVRRHLLEPALNLLPGVSVAGRAKRYIRVANTPNPERYCSWLLLRRFEPSALLGPGLLPQDGQNDWLASMRAHYTSAPAQSELNRLLYVDLKMTLADNDLRKVVGASEIAGVKVRFPYLDPQLAEFSGRLPADLKVRGLEKRYLFKLATRDLLPAEILRKKKHGFGLPIGVWLKTDPQLRSYSREVLLDSRTYQRGYFRRQFIEQVIASMEADYTPYYGDLLWLFLMLELWHRNHVERSERMPA